MTFFYRTAQYVPNKKPQNYKKCLKELIQLYQNAELQVTVTHCYNKFKTVFTQISQTYQIQIYTIAAQSRLPRAERNNRVIKEREQCAYHDLEYQNVPKTVLIYMMQEYVNKLNYFPAQYGISPSYSPHMIIHKQILITQLMIYTTLANMSLVIRT